MGRKVGIIAYGELEDRQRVEALSRLAKKSVSAWIIEKIRAAHDEVFAPMTLGDSGGSETDRSGNERITSTD